MLKLISKSEGCFSACVRSVLAGGVLGVILGYFVASVFFTNPPKPDMFYFIRWGFATAGFLVGVVLWTIGETIYFIFFIKSDEEDKV